MRIEGSAVKGGVIAVCGVVLIGIVTLGHIEKLEPAVPSEKPLRIESVSSCDHEWFDEDEMLNYDPKCYRCLKCGESRWG